MVPSDSATASSTNPAPSRRCSRDQCRWTAWQLHCAGTDSFEAIARAVNRTHHPDYPDSPAGPHREAWAKRAIARCSKIVADSIAHSDIDPFAEYVHGLRQDMKALLLMARDSETSENAKVSVRKAIIEVRGKIAVALGAAIDGRSAGDGTEGQLDPTEVGHWSPEKRARILEALETPDEASD